MSNSRSETIEDTYLIASSARSPSGKQGVSRGDLHILCACFLHVLSVVEVFALRFPHGCAADATTSQLPPFFHVDPKTRSERLVADVSCQLGRFCGTCSSSCSCRHHHRCFHFSTCSCAAWCQRCDACFTLVAAPLTAPAHRLLWNNPG